MLEFLKKNKATTKNFLSSDPDEDVLGKVDIASIPISLIYDKEGKLSKAFHNNDQEYGETGFTYDDHVVPHVKTLLAK